MKCIHLRARAGLANRIRALASAEWAAARHGLELAVTWDRDQFMPAHWQDLFENELAYPDPGLADRDTLRLENPTWIDVADPEVQRAEVLELDTCEAFSTDPAVKALSYRFWAEVRPYLLRLRPRQEVRELVEAVSDRFGHTVLGGHIRLGGGTLAFDTPNSVTPEQFFEEVDRQRDQTPGLQLYLATDTADLVPRFKERYGSALITMDEHVEPGFRTFESSRNVGIALAEILILARTHKLLGTYFSSFGVLAGALGALPYYELGKPTSKHTWRKFSEGPGSAGGHP